MITDHHLIQALDNLATAAEDSHPEVAGVLLTLAGLMQRPGSKAELRELFLASCRVSERELATMNREETATN